MPFVTYFDWLKARIEYFDGPTSYSHLLEKLHSITYIPVMEKDFNRAVDGMAIRDDFFEETGNETFIDSPCSFLEFLYALSVRMNYIYSDVYEDKTQDMFWLMIRNMGLWDFDDLYFLSFDDADSAVEQAVDRVIDRMYDEDGSGGLFPLENPMTNQRNVEVWYQMNQYLAELMRKEGRL